MRISWIELIYLRILLVQADFGKNRRSFEGIKEALENRGVHQELRKSNAGKRGKISTKKSSFKVDKMLRSSWKVDKH